MSFWYGLWRLEKQRKQILKNCPDGPLKDFYAADFISHKLAIADAELVALDFETTGLDMNHDHVISYGLIEIHALAIHLNTASHQYIKTTRNMPAHTAAIHQITDDMVADGEVLENMMGEILKRLRHKILLAHHARIELGFLNKITMALYQQPFICPVIDTQVLGRRQLNRHEFMQKMGALRLFNLRKNYGLPVYKSHNAYYDALATAELFLALLSDLYPQHDCKTGELISRV